MVDDTNIKYLLLPKKAVVKTPLQTFIIQPKTHIWRNHHEQTLELIRLGKLITIIDLIEQCENKLELIPTQARYYDF